jgi:pyridoxine/pyridoxamine 5'-phosphate oxidase
MTLSTVDADGSPDARVLILKDVTEGCWWFASSSESAKGRQLGASPAAALTFYWPAHARSVRIRGPVMAATATQSANDFGARGLGARAVALASKESQPARNREEIDEAVAAARSRLAGDPSLRRRRGHCGRCKQTPLNFGKPTAIVSMSEFAIAEIRTDGAAPCSGRSYLPFVVWP